MALRIDVFDIDVTVHRGRRGGGVARDLGDRVMAKYAAARTSSPDGKGQTSLVLEAVARAAESFISRRATRSSVAIGDRRVGWLDGSPNGSPRVALGPSASRNGNGTETHDATEPAPLRLATAEPERHVTDGMPRFIAPPLETPEPKPFVQPPPLVRKPASGAAGFRPLFKQMEHRAPAAEPDAQKAARITRHSGAGRPLDEATRKEMERFFGADFGDVRVHADEKTAAHARELGADAFTIGKDIYFDGAKFDPSTETGKGLLGHELTHVLQQNGVARRKVQGFSENGGSDALEAEADATRRAFLSLRAGSQGDDLAVERHVCHYRANRPPRADERARLDVIAAMALQIGEDILRTEHPTVLQSAQVVESLQLHVDLSLAQLSDEDAARIWGRRLASAIALQLSVEARAASPIRADAVLRQATPVTAGSPAAAHDRLKAEAKVDAHRVRKLLTGTGSPITFFLETEPAIMKIIESWAERPPEPGLRMTPLDYLIVALQGEVFTVEEWFVDQWTNAFDQIFERMSPKRLARFKALMKSQARDYADEKPIGMVHFEVDKVLIEAGEVGLELGGAFLTGGGSLVAKIAAWCVNTLPKLYEQAKAVIALVDRIRDIKLDDIKRFLSPYGIGQLLVDALFARAGTLPVLGEGGGEGEGQRAAGPSEAGALTSLLRKVMAVIGALTAGYNKAADAVNKVLARLDITQMKWFEPFSMAYAGIFHAVEKLSDPAGTLNQAAQALRGLVGGFFQVLKEKITGISESIKNHLDFVGKGGKLLAELADKAVEMVVNFIVTHPPSAVVKTALRVLETAADKPVIKLLRENVPYADDIIKKISESDTVKGLLKPLHGPVSAVTEMTDTVAGGATKVVTDLETQAIALIGDGAAMITNLGGAGTQVAAGGGASQPAKAPPAGGGFLGAVKRGLHTYLLEFGTQSLLRHGKRLGKAALQKGVSAAKGLIGKLLGPKVPFKVRDERHELWVEDRQGEVVVLVATEPKTMEEEIAEFEARIAKIPDPKQRTVVERAVDNVKDLNREIKASANQGRDIEGRKKRLVRIVAKLLETVELRETSRFAIRDPRVYRNAGRDIVVVETPDGPRAFYKRTGRGGPDEGWAGKGNWVPFDGFLLSRLPGRPKDREWFIKPRTGRKGSGSSDEDISRFIAEVFGRGDVRVGEEVTDIGVLNAWLRSNGADVGGGYRVGDELNFPKGKEQVVGIPMGKVPLLAGRPEAKFVFVEIGAGDLRASIRIAKQGNGTVRVIAVDPASAPASAVQELEALGGQVVRGVASDLPAGTADHVFQYFPWTISGAGSHVEGGTWRLIEDTVGLLKPGGAAHFVTEDKETAKYLLAEANRHGMKGVLTPSTAGAAAPGAGGSGVPDFGPHRDVWQVNVYK